MAFILGHKRKLTLVALDREMAYMAGINPDLFQLLFYLMLSCALVLGIRILGIVLVSAILIIPVSTARLLSRSFKALAWWTVAIAEFTVMAGLLLAYFLDLPAGALIVLTGSTLFSLAFIASSLLRRAAQRPQAGK
jgi:zinc transport system permease protein